MGKTFIPSSSHFCTSVPTPNFLLCQLLPLFPLMHHCVIQWDLTWIFMLCCLTCSCFDSSKWANEADKQLSGQAQTSETCSAAWQWYGHCWAPWQGHISPGSMTARHSEGTWRAYSNPVCLSNRLTVTVTLFCLQHAHAIHPKQAPAETCSSLCSFCEDRANLTPYIRKKGFWGVGVEFDPWDKTLHLSNVSYEFVKGMGILAGWHYF